MKMILSRSTGLSFVVLVMMILLMTSAQEQLEVTHSPEQLFNLPCCNECPQPQVNIIPIYVEKEITVNIPYPVLKPYSSHYFPNGTCPDGFVRPTPSSNKCIRTIRVSADVACPSGFFRVGDDTCVRVFISNNQDTLKQVIDKVVCPPGYIQPEDGSIACMHAETNETVVSPDHEEHDEEPLVCPEGYFRITPWRCVKVVNCPSEGGFAITEDGRCMKTRIECPVGFKLLDRTQCIREEINCPSGYLYNNETKSCDKIVIVTRCPDGQVDVDGVCKEQQCITTECAPQVQCRKGYTWKKQRPSDCCPKCVPCVCSAGYEPVCTTDNISYPNECVANCLQAEIKHTGSCDSSDRVDGCTVDTTFVDWRPKIICPDGYTYNEAEKSCFLISTSTSRVEKTTTTIDKKTRPLKEIIIKALETKYDEPESGNTLQSTNTVQLVYPHTLSRDTLATLNILDFEF